MAADKSNPFDHAFDATVANISSSELEKSLSQLRRAEAEAKIDPTLPTERVQPEHLEKARQRRRSQPIPTRGAPTPTVFGDVDQPAGDQTVVLDTKQHGELMALRAQQDATLQKRFEKNVAVMFTDLVGSTAYYEKYGDMKGREKVLTHNALLFPLIQNSGGVIIKTIGDAIMACFDSVNDALAAAAGLQHALAEHNRDVPAKDDQIHIRIAINYGVAIAQDGDVYGDVVNVAARIEHEAPADAVYVSETVRQESTGWPLESVGAVSFKGKTGKAQLYRLEWQKVSKPETGRGPAGLPPRYELGDMLGHGSIGDTFRANDRSTGRRVRIKGLHGFLAKDANARRAFRRAVDGMARLQHDGIVRLLDSSADAPEPYFITEDQPGRTLEHLVARHGRPPHAHAALIGYRIAQILAYAHAQGVVHGDVKPEHVLVTEHGELKLASFGLANVASSQVERTGSALGNPAFMAPEQVVGSGTDSRTDVYSLGALLYFLVCGQPPYEAAASVQATREVTSGGFTPIKRLNPDAPERLVQLIGRSLSILPDSRPKDMAELAAELAELFKNASLNPKRDLPRFLLDTWPQTQLPVTKRDEGPSLLEDEATPPPSPVTAPRSLTVPVMSQAGMSQLERAGLKISVPVAAVGAVVIALLAFAAGWRMGASRAEEYFGKLAANSLQPVGPATADGDAKPDGAANPGPDDSGCTGTGGSLSVMVIGAEDCRVAVAGQALGVAPIFKADAPLGDCRIEVRCANGRGFQVRRTLTADSVEKLVVQAAMLTPLGDPGSASAAPGATASPPGAAPSPGPAVPTPPPAQPKEDEDSAP